MTANTICQNCESHVSFAFARVYGDNDNVLHRCPNCISNNDGGVELLRKGIGAGKHLEN